MAPFLRLSMLRPPIIIVFLNLTNKSVANIRIRFWYFLLHVRLNLPPFFWQLHCNCLFVVNWLRVFFEHLSNSSFAELRVLLKFILRLLLLNLIDLFWIDLANHWATRLFLWLLIDLAAHWGVRLLLLRLLSLRLMRWFISAWLGGRWVVIWLVLWMVIQLHLLHACLQVIGSAKVLLNVCMISKIRLLLLLSLARIRFKVSLRSLALWIKLLLI